MPGARPPKASSGPEGSDELLAEAPWKSDHRVDELLQLLEQARGQINSASWSDREELVYQLEAINGAIVTAQQIAWTIAVEARADRDAANPANP